tara:strand:+ start:433 stop:633 length:201 start_codon:yes stop_codon:yes gene_type:complete
LYDNYGQGETANVADLPEHQSDLKRLTRLMLQHCMKNMDHTLSMYMITEVWPRQKPRHKMASSTAI